MQLQNNFLIDEGSQKTFRCVTVFRGIYFNILSSDPFQASVLVSSTMCLKEIGVRTETLFTNRGSIVNIIGGPIYVTFLWVRGSADFRNSQQFEIIFVCFLEWSWHGIIQGCRTKAQIQFNNCAQQWKSFTDATIWKSFEVNEPTTADSG